MKEPSKESRLEINAKQTTMPNFQMETMPKQQAYLFTTEMFDLSGLQSALTIAEAETCAAIGPDGVNFIVRRHHQGLVARTTVDASLRHFF